MRKADVLTTYLFLQVSILFCRCSLHSTFRHFEVLKTQDIIFDRIKRSTTKLHLDRITVSFTAFRTRFTMLLTPGTHVLHPKAQARIVGRRGKEKHFKIDRGSFFSGTVNGDPKYEVYASRFNGVWIVHIHTPQEFYAVEPLSFYDHRAKHRHLLVYRGRDIRTDNDTKPFCGAVSSKGVPKSLVVNKHRPMANSDFIQSDLLNSAIPWAGRLSKHLSTKLAGVGKNLRKRESVTNSMRRDSAGEYVRETESASHNARMSEYVVYKTRKRKRASSNANNTKCLEKLLKNADKDKGLIDDLCTDEEEGKGGKKRNRKPNPQGRTLTGHYPKNRTLYKGATHCDVLAIADYNLYKGIGRRNVVTVISTLVHVYALVDRVFRNTTFGELKSGYGIVVRNFLVHTSYFDRKKSSPFQFGSYNVPDSGQTPRHILYAMDKFSWFLDYCLVHLSMQRNMGISIGYAAHAQPGTFTGWRYGICGRNDYFNIRSRLPRPMNVGITTVRAHSGGIMPLKLYSLILAHELGHNWGASHDVVTKRSSQCSPSTADGGKYLMHPYVGLGKDPNSDKFSPCSIEEITTILRERAHKCFLNQRTVAELCGNGLLEPAEDCDPGFLGLESGEDPCCTRQCRFRPGAVCSPRTETCCTNDCQVANSSHRCYPKGVMHECYQQAFCKGNNPWECPIALALPNKTPCEDQGWCWHGRCLSFCEKLGMSMNPPRDFRPCECEHSREAMCQHCCIEKGVPWWRKGRCFVMGGRVREGSPCLKGKCSNGVCEPYDFKKDIILPKFFLPNKSTQNEASKTLAAALPSAATTMVIATLLSISGLFFFLVFKETEEMLSRRESRRVRGRERENVCV